jgi:hypothetical protein
VNIPGVNVVIKELPPVRSAPTDTGVWFVVGTSDRGPLLPVLVGSLSEFVTVFGDRQSYSVLYDALDVFFREGGHQAWVSRVVGPAPVYASKSFNDNAAAVSLIISAIGPGAYGNAYKVGILAGTVSGFQIQVTDTANTVLENSGDLLDQASAVAWGVRSAYVRVALGVSALNPIPIAAAALTAGTDDRANATDTQWADALARFVHDLGPGQVSAPGRTSTNGRNQVTAHAVANNRVALKDLPDTLTVSTLTTAINASRQDGRWAASFAPWDVVQGVVTNTTRVVPPCARIAGNLARNDQTQGAGQPAAGELGQALYVLAVSQTWTDSQRNTLNAQGVNVSVSKFGGIRTYGWRSEADPNADPYWIDFGAARTIMSYAAQGGAILETFLFEEIDGQGRLFSTVTGVLTALANEFYASGDLFGATADQAFSVICDASNNTVTTIANRELHATVALRCSEFAEMIEFDLVKVPVNQPVVA